MSSYDAQGNLLVDIASGGSGGSTSLTVNGNPVSTSNPLPVQAPAVGSSTATPTNVTAASTSTAIFASPNANRKGSMMTNESTSSTMYLAWGATASLTAYAITVPPGAAFINMSGTIIQTAISAIWKDPSGTVNGVCRVTEFT